MITTEQVILRLIVATVLGGLVGIERERLERAAGLRTHALVGVGSALFIIVSAFGFADILGTPGVSLDPSRIAAQGDPRRPHRQPATTGGGTPDRVGARAKQRGR